MLRNAFMRRPLFPAAAPAMAMRRTSASLWGVRLGSALGACHVERCVTCPAATWTAVRYVTSSQPAPPVDSEPSAPSAEPSKSTASSSTHNDIAVVDSKGNHVPVTSISTFNEIPNMPPWLAEGLKNLGYPSTTGIQGVTIPLLLEGKDIIGLAPTGSGKTVAFAVPALSRFQRSPIGQPTILVLAPTRELVQQTAKVFRDVSDGAVSVCEAYGGAPREVQLRRLSRGCDVLVACPGRLTDFLRSGEVSLEHMSFLVFDEADRLLDMGFKVQLDDILSFSNPSHHVQAMMWSATWPESVQNLAQEYLSPESYLIRVGTAGSGLQVNENIKQHVFFKDTPQEKIEHLVALIDDGTIDENTAKIMIFVERQSDTEEAASHLARTLGINSRSIGVIHGGMSQRFRDNVMASFKQSRVRILVATDVASRGLDFPDVTCVVNFHAPKNIDSYCHRIGRTGRAGRKGDAFTFLTSKDGSLAEDLEAYLRKCEMQVPPQLTELAEDFSRRQRYRGRGGGGGGYRGGGGNRGRFGGHSRRDNGSAGRYDNSNRYDDGWGGGGGGGGNGNNNSDRSTGFGNRNHSSSNGRGAASYTSSRQRGADYTGGGDDLF